MTNPFTFLGFGSLFGLIISLYLYTLKRKKWFSISPFVMIFCMFWTSVPEIPTFIGHNKYLVFLHPVATLKLREFLHLPYIGNIFLFHNYIHYLFYENDSRIGLIIFIISLVIYSILLFTHIRKYRIKFPIIELKQYSKYLLLIFLIVSGYLVISHRAFGFNEKKHVFGNLHAHITGDFGTLSYEELINASVEEGFKFISITIHSHNKDSFDSIYLKCINETRIFCIPGEQIQFEKNGSWINILAIGIEEWIPHETNLSLEEILKNIHNQKGIAIIPYTVGDTTTLSLEHIKRYQDQIDAIECYDSHHGSSMDEMFVTLLSRYRNIPCVFNSDTYYKEHLISMYNDCEMQNISKEELFKAIKLNKCKLAMRKEKTIWDYEGQCVYAEVPPLWCKACLNYGWCRDYWSNLNNTKNETLQHTNQTT